MNLRPSSRNTTPSQAVRLWPRRGRENGFAVLVIFVLLSIMVVFVASNTVVLRHLHQEIKLVEKRQLKKFEAAPANPLVQTNVPNVGLEKRPD